MIDLRPFVGFELAAGFVIRTIETSHGALRDALDREAVAQTHIHGREFHLLIRDGLSDQELSVSIYHEILEAAAVASWPAPAAVTEFNEGDFERAAQEAHIRWGEASPANLNRLLQFYGFRGE